MIQLTEFDDALDDQTQVFVDCSSLQLGANGFDVIVKEDSGFVS